MIMEELQNLENPLIANLLFELSYLQFDIVTQYME